MISGNVNNYIVWALVALVASCLTAVFRSWLVPRRVMVDLVALWQKRSEDAEKHAEAAEKRAEQWQAAYHAVAKTASTQAAQIGELMETSRLTQHIVDSIPRRGDQQDWRERGDERDG